MRKIIYSAAGSLVVTDKATGKVVEVLMAKRKNTTSFFPGYHVLPGGVIDSADVELAKTINKWKEPRDGGFSEAAYRVAFIREFFEEVGILLTKEGLLHGSELQHWQYQLTHDQVTFSELLDHLDLTISDLALQDLRYSGQRLRPPFMKKTYLARYYLLVISPEQKVDPVVNTDEIESAGWYRPSRVLDEYRQLRIQLPPPTLQQMRYFVQHSLENAIINLRKVRKEKYGVDFPVELRPDVEVIPLPSSTLPPHETTNMVILGGKECFLVDPSPSSDEARGHMLEVLERVKKERRILKGIFLTHHHSDHVEGVDGLKNELGLPVIAHAATAAQLPDVVDRSLVEETVFVAKDQDGNDLDLKVIFTPGHAKGSLTILVPSRRIAVVGDLMAGIGTVIIDPPDGNLREYLRSLRRLQQHELDMIIPGHGPFILNPLDRIDEYIQHRMTRHRNIQRAIADGASSLKDILTSVYTDVPEKYHFMAARSIVAHLFMLFEDGVITRDRLESLLK